MNFLPKKHLILQPSVPQTPPVRLISYQVANMQGLGRRDNQEDAFAFVNALDVREMKRNGLFAILADGMGGMSSGEIASQIAIDSLKADFFRFDREGDLVRQLQDSAARASEAVFQRLGGSGGSTLIACLFFQQFCYYVSAGDSRLYLWRDGQLLQINRDQNIRNLRYLEAIRNGSLNPAAAEADEERDAIVAFLGMADSIELDCFYRPLPLQDGDVFLLCSDGVSDVITEEETAACLALKSPLEICRALEERILSKQKAYQDNYTALVVCCRK